MEEREFRVGDRVVCVKGDHWNKEGCVGEIVGIAPIGSIKVNYENGERSYIAPLQLKHADEPKEHERTWFSENVEKNCAGQLKKAIATIGKYTTNRDIWISSTTNKYVQWSVAQNPTTWSEPAKSPIENPMSQLNGVIPYDCYGKQEHKDWLDKSEFNKVGDPILTKYYTVELARSIISAATQSNQTLFGVHEQRVPGRKYTKIGDWECEEIEPCGS